ncbi:hypothetical protein D3C86_2096010 [compost metagenome]
MRVVHEALGRELGLGVGVDPLFGQRFVLGDPVAIAEVEVDARRRDVDQAPYPVREAALGDMPGAEHVGAVEGLVPAPGAR